MQLTIARKGQDRPIDLAVVRAPIQRRAVLRVAVEGDHLSVEAIGGRQVFEFARAKPVPVIAASDAEFWVDGRYHTHIAFTRDASGKVIGAVLNPGRWAQQGTRIE